MDKMDLSCENIFKGLVYVVAAYVTLKIIQDNCDIGLGGLFTDVEKVFEGFTDGMADVGGMAGDDASAGSNGVVASEGVTRDSGPQKVQGLGRTPSTCYPQPTLKAEDLLPKEDSAAIQEFNTAKPAGEGILQGVNMLDAGFHVGVNTIGQSLKNANRQLCAEPPNPQVQVSPWMMSSIGPDLMRRPLGDSEGCAASAGPVEGAGAGATTAAAAVGAAPVGA